ncbi:MAG: efflux RND transporter periplasmic adaptor subunit [Ignavibacteriae bacterium]|nr:efflux RND transporter periplasmic adaptor subunit [Ignavibacteria bacterium]MBI3365519.1 efflux RND transporter periplasmic adaptor subunit [Ignavibacteriota bacterium]
MNFRKNMSILLLVVMLALCGVLLANRFQAGTDSRETSALPRVRVEKPQRKSVSSELQLNGDVLPWQQATLYSKVAGYLKEIRVDKGDWVKQGDVLAVIDDRETEKEYERAVADFHLQEITYNRLQEALPKTPDLVSKQDVDVAEAKYESAKAAMERLKVLVDYATIRAPFAGVITQRWVDPGAMIQAANMSMNAMAIVKIASMDKLRIRVDVPESEVLLVKVGTKAKVSVRELPGHEFEGTVARFGVALEQSTRTMQAEIDLANSKHTLRPGMFAQVTLHFLAEENALTLPAAALVIEKNQTFVYCVEQNTVKKKPIVIGTDDGVHPVIAQGLTGDELVIVSGKEFVVDGSKVNPIQK